MGGKRQKPLAVPSLAFAAGLHVSEVGQHVFRFRTFTLAYVAIAVLGLSSVMASGQQAENAKKRAKPTGHCVTSLSKPDAAPNCYDTFTAAIAAATGGQITDAPADPRAAMTDQRIIAKLKPTGDKKSYKQSAAGDQPTASEVVIAIIFAGENFEGPSLIFTAGRACTDKLSDIDFQVPKFPHLWQLEVRAIRTFNNCHARLWQHINFSGAMIDFGVSPPQEFLKNGVGSIQFS